MLTRATTLTLATLTAAALSTAVLAAPKHTPTPKSTPEPNDPAFHAALLSAAGQYKSWFPVSNAPKFAPALCAMANPKAPPELSRSDDPTTHGRKVYFLYANHPNEYYAAATTPSQPIGQTIVKESWVPKEADGKPLPIASDVKHGLFIITKLDPKTPNTDQGWVYGTITADGKTITSAGRVQSCMGCHDAAPHDHLFGLRPPEANPAEPTIDLNDIHFHLIDKPH